MRTIVWFRGKELRLSDHAPLRDALDHGDEIVPLFVLDPYFFAPDRAKELPHRIQFLLDSLVVLRDNIAARGSRLIVVPGRSVDVIPRLFETWKADRVVAHRWVEPIGRERDRRIAEALGDAFELFEGETLHRPGTLRTGGGAPYAVFTRFAETFRKTVAIAETLPTPRKLPPLPRGLTSVKEAAVPDIEDLGIARNPDVLEGGERAAHARLRRFVREAIDDYPTARDRMDLPGTSRLSADLKFGTISIRTVWNTIDADVKHGKAAAVFQNELLWREFSHTSLWDHPDLLTKPFRPAFASFPWKYDRRLWNAWVEGTTGYPVVDASARQLLGAGFVHNRARMISASFLAKHLLIDFRRGEAHYLKYLTDGDWAQNDMGWQWSSGSGCDAQPYFRVFNPIAQGEKFDPNGDYVRRWVPELARMPAKYIHQPWTAPAEVLREAGVTIGKTYPEPVVDHTFARKRFLDLAARHLKGGKGETR